MRAKSLMLPTTAAIVVAVLALALGKGRGGSSLAPSGALAGGKARLTIAGYTFAPAALTVRAGATITVTNADGTAHTATAGSGAFDSGTLRTGQSARLTLKKPGTYTYACQFHAFMTGTIRVVD